MVKLFLKHKPDLLSVPNKNGFTCAHIAAAKGSVAVVKELMRLNQESVINARISVCLITNQLDSFAYPKTILENEINYTTFGS